MTTYKIVTLLLATLAISSVSSEVLSACDSCKSMVQNFVDAPKNPIKMNLMKVSLLSMCAGTSHEDDCSKTVNKLDVIASKLAPYLKDTEAVCSKLQMCGESPSEIAQLASLFWRKSNADLTNDIIAKRQICEECKIGSAKFHRIFSSERTVLMARSAARHFVCKSAGKFNTACNLFFESLIPEFFEQSRVLLADGDAVCGDMQLCEASKKTFVAQRPTKALNEVWKSLGSVKTSNGEELMSCFECTLSADALIEEFVNKRQATADDIQKPICEKVSDAWTAGCNDFFHMYLSTVLYLTYNQLDGRGVCTIMHTCEKKEAALEFNHFITNESKLERCEKVESFIAENAMYLQEHAAEAIVANVCGALPTSFHALCSRSTHHISSKMFDRFGKVASARAFCPLIV